jgi:drug/metabolite transporter (DMT)-like permease
MKIAAIALALCVMTWSGSLGALFFKKVTTGIQGFHQMALLRSPSLYPGGLFYLTGAILNIILLRFMDYSILYPMTALTYIWTLVLSYAVFKERINKGKIAAIFFILLGIIVINI